MSVCAKPEFNRNQSFTIETGILIVSLSILQKRIHCDQKLISYICFFSNQKTTSAPSQETTTSEPSGPPSDKKETSAAPAPETVKKDHSTLSTASFSMRSEVSKVGFMPPL